MLLLAGPGTGKTYRLGMRIKHLVEERGSIRLPLRSSHSRPPQRRTKYVTRISDPRKPDVYLRHQLETSKYLDHAQSRISYCAGEHEPSRPSRPPDVVAAEYRTRSALLGDSRTTLWKGTGGSQGTRRVPAAWAMRERRFLLSVSFVRSTARFWQLAAPSTTTIRSTRLPAPANHLNSPTSTGTRPAICSSTSTKISMRASSS